MAALNHFLQVPIKEGQQQCTDMRTIHIGIGHNDNLVVPKFVDIEFWTDRTA